MRSWRARRWVVAGAVAVAAIGVGGGTLIGLSWLWIFLLVAVVVGGSVALVEWRGRRSTLRPSWLVTHPDTH